MIHDAVVIVPGLMGSELVADGKTIWGFRKLSSFIDIVLDRSDVLQVTEEDRAGSGRVVATRLIQAPAFLSWWGALEPYGPLLNKVLSLSLDPRAVLPFPYDWRLSIAFNSKLLAETAERHLASCANWSRHTTSRWTQQRFVSYS